MTSLVLGDLILESLKTSVMHLDSVKYGVA
jgi:hypothetical protein